MTEPFVSVVVAAYNVAGYVGMCLDSVVAQRCRHSMQIVVVDDGSTDATAAVCRDYAARFPDMVEVIRHRSNLGLSEARNTGLAAARGEWVMMVDGDDMLMPDAVERLIGYAHAAGAGVDVVVGAFTRNPDLRVSGASAGVSRRMSARDALAEMLYQRGGMTHSAWGRIFRREAIDEFRFTAGLLYEDLEWTARMMPRLKGDVIQTSDVVYFYRSRTGSILDVWDMRRLDVMSITRDICARMNALGDRRLMRAAADRQLSAAFNMLILLGRNGMSRRCHAADECWNVIRRGRCASLCDPRVRLKNKFGILASFVGRRAFQWLWCR